MCGATPRKPTHYTHTHLHLLVYWVQLTFLFEIGSRLCIQKKTANNHIWTYFINSTTTLELKSICIYHIITISMSVRPHFISVIRYIVLFYIMLWKIWRLPSKISPKNTAFYNNTLDHSILLWLQLKLIFTINIYITSIWSIIL